MKRKRQYVARGRDAGTGRFIPVARARARRRTAVVERVRVGRRRRAA